MMEGKTGYEMFGYRRKNDVVSADEKLFSKIRQSYKDCLLYTSSFMINDDSPNTQTLGMGRPYIACGGYVNEGDKISVYAELPQGQAGNAPVYVNMLDQNVYEQGYAQISKDVLTTTVLMSLIHI